MRTEPPDTGHGRWLSPILLAGFVLRVIGVLLLGTEPYSDALGYWERGVALSRTGTYPDLFMPPGYSFLIAALVTLFGESTLPLFLFQSVVGTATIWFVYQVASSALDQRRGLIAATIVALFPPFIFYTGLVLTETLFISLMWSAVFAVKCLKRSGAILIGGLLIGLAAYIRPLIAYVPPLGLALLLLRPAWRRSTAVTVVLGVLIVESFVLAPRFAYTWSRSGRCFISTNSGYNLLISNNRFADGRDGGQIILQQKPDPLEGATDPVERMNRSGKLAWSWILHHPLDFLWKGTRAIWATFGLGSTFDYYYRVGLYPWMQTGIRLPLLVAMVVPWIVLCLAALPQLFSSPARTALSLELSLLIFYLATHFIGFGVARFRLPVIPVFAMLAALWCRPLPDSNAEEPDSWDSHRPIVLPKLRRAEGALAALSMAFVCTGWIRQVLLKIGWL